MSSCPPILERFLEDVDIIQVSREHANFVMLRELGRTEAHTAKARSFGHLEEWLSAEYIMSEGNENVILCERGIRTFETYARNTLDIARCLLKKAQPPSIIVDPSHGTGNPGWFCPCPKGLWFRARTG